MFKNKLMPAGCTPYKGQSKTLILSTNVDKKSLETEFLIAICSWEIPFKMHKIIKKNSDFFQEKKYI